MKKKFKLDSEEQAIEDTIEKLVPVSHTERKRIESILEKARKTSSISLRINNHDLAKIKEKAKKNGLPYQTLITHVLHRYVSEEFFDKNEVTKTFRLLRMTS